MQHVSIRDLRNHGGDVIDRVVGGEPVTITRSGRPVAELRPVRQSGPPTAILVKRWSRLPPMDAASLRADLDAVIDSRL